MAKLKVPQRSLLKNQHSDSQEEHWESKFHNSGKNLETFSLMTLMRTSNCSTEFALLTPKERDVDAMFSSPNGKQYVP